MGDTGLDAACDFSSAGYWEERYRGGGTSGAGSYGRLAAFKAAFVNGFVAANAISRVIEFGCGDGNQLGLLSVPRYTGVDVSPTILARCRTRFPHYVFVDPAELADMPPAELGLSMDVVFHLIEDAVFADYMRTLFWHATDYVIIYSSNCDLRTPDRHVRTGRSPTMSAAPSRSGRCARSCRIPIHSTPRTRRTRHLPISWCSAERATSAG